MSLCILVLFTLSFPLALLNVLLITDFFTRIWSSSFLRPKSFFILFALFGPSFLGKLVSVTPAISCSPFLTIYKASTLMSGPTMHPRMDFLFLKPLLLSVKHECPADKRRRTLPLANTPYFIGKPCLSFPPAILNMYPLNSSPKESASTS